MRPSRPALCASVGAARALGGTACTTLAPSETAAPAPPAVQGWPGPASAADVVERVVPSIVTVRVDGGSGMVFRPDIVIINARVVGDAVDVAEQLLEDGSATHPYFGVTLGRVTPQIRSELGSRPRTVPSTRMRLPGPPGCPAATL